MTRGMVMLAMVGLWLGSANGLGQPGGTYTIRTIAGGDPVRDGVPARRGLLRSVSGLAFDAAGRLWIADSSGHRIRVVTPDGSQTDPYLAMTMGQIETKAGVGSASVEGDGGPAVSAYLASPTAVAFGEAGEVYIADSGSRRIRKIDERGIITTIAGGGEADPGTAEIGATTARLGVVAGLAVGGGAVYFIEAGGFVRSVGTDGRLRTIAGGGNLGMEADGGPARNARLLQPWGLARDSRGNLYVAEQARYAIRKITPEGVISTVAGTGVPGATGDDGPAVQAQINMPLALWLDGMGGLYVLAGDRIRVISADGVIRTHLQAYALQYYRSLAPDRAGNLWLGGSSSIALLRSDVLVTVIGDTWLDPDKAFAREALVSPVGLTGDSDGLVYFSEPGAQRIRVIDTQGMLRTLFERSGAMSLGDGGLLDSASLRPRMIVSGPGGDLWVDDELNARIRRVTRWNSVVNTVAGNGTRGVAGDGGPATAAQITTVTDMAVDGEGAVYFINFPRVRKVSRDGRMDTMAGSGERGFTEDGGAAVGAKMEPSGLAVERDGSLLIAEAGNSRIRRVGPEGVLRTVAGGGTGSGSGVATGLRIDPPRGIASLADGSFVFSTYRGIYHVNAAGWLERIAGGEVPGFTGDGPALEVLVNPSTLWAREDGSILFLDSDGQRIRCLDPER